MKKKPGSTKNLYLKREQNYIIIILSASWACSTVNIHLIEELLSRENITVWQLLRRFIGMSTGTDSTIFYDIYITFSPVYRPIDIWLFSFSKLTQLQELDVSSNELKAESISMIGDMTSLIELNLRLCGLVELPQR